MISIPQSSPSVNTYKVPIPFGYLPLLVDVDGSRWLILNPFAEFLGLSLAKEVLPRIDVRARYWGHRSIAGKVCLPADKANEMMGVLRTSYDKQQAIVWLGRHACETLHNFTIPEPAVPMLAEDPEPIACPAIPQPAPAESGLRTFNFGAVPIRVAVRDGEPWFAATDVCSVLEMGNVSQAMTRLDGDEKGVISNDTPGGIQGLLHVSESGLYSLVLGSRKPEAKAFKRWITHEVIPAIRKTGSYGVVQRDPLEVLNDPAAMRGLLLGYSEKVLTLECKVQEQGATISTLEPKAAGLDRIATMTTDRARTLTDAAKILQQPPRKFISFLQAEGWIYRQNSRWMAYQTKITAGLMEHKYLNVQHDSGTEFDVAQPLITTKGIAKLAAMLGVPAAA